MARWDPPHIIRRVMPSFKSVVPFFPDKVPFLVVFLIQKGMWPYRHAKDCPLVTLIIYIYIYIYIYIVLKLSD